MVGKILRFCSARACLRALDRTLTEGRASAGTGVDRPLLKGELWLAETSPCHEDVVCLAVVVGRVACAPCLTGGRTGLIMIQISAGAGRGTRRQLRKLRMNRLARPRSQYAVVRVVDLCGGSHVLPRSTAGVPGERLIVARSRGAKQGSFRAIESAVKQVGSCEERGRED